MKRIFITCFTFFSAQSVLSSEDVILFKSSDGKSIVHGITHTIGTRNAMIVENDEFLTSIIQVEANCGRNTIFETYTAYFNKQHNLVASDFLTGKPKSVIPNTPGESIYNFICYITY
ncbi:hypothetical protein BKG95_04100 [Rodentibacter pneumotropicus]|uniref:Uncharacterized protein n=1 Tax=Rodentibacter pneumotropicus TaxID=758 RepID=A0AAW5LDZ6_9PAST|nr:hypothetical protein [Rodentibacter pneumotropicus]MCQ9121696.1 hypothetical protein [Rodentibacter pneumotropicus]OOF68589.1 hypothetical protein BKG95_04100 [Rodentibacter pneumotropicus]